MSNYSGKVPNFDFDKGEFVLINGKVQMLIGEGAIRLWIQKILRTELNRYKIYAGTGYGTKLEEHLIGHVYPRDYIIVEIGQSIKEAILKNDNISDVKINNIDINGSKLTWDITVRTDYGNVEEKGEASE